jgi:hypothetical protein
LYGAPIPIAVVFRVGAAAITRHTGNRQSRNALYGAARNQSGAA